MRLRVSARYVLPLVSFFVAAFAGAQPTGRTLTEAEISTRARIAILGLPYYGVFDLLAFEVNGSTVTLGGYVYRAPLKGEAEQAIEKIPGGDAGRQQNRSAPRRGRA